jgi:fibronectin type 3 domain-containing protein
MKKLIPLILFLAVPMLLANTPGQHTVKLTWTASTTAGATYNIYRGTAAGVCTGTPTPYATGITTASYVDQNTPAGTYFYNVSAVSAAGGESACDGEISIPVPNVSTATASGLAGSVQ